MNNRKQIWYIDRSTAALVREKIYGATVVGWLYKKRSFCILRSLVRYFFVASPFLSHLYARWKKSRFSVRQIAPFVRDYQISLSDFQVPQGGFASFDAFFSRSLMPGARALQLAANVVIAPADGRYLAFQSVKAADHFWIKGVRFNLEKLLVSSALSGRFAQGSMLIIRLAPVDYHRFHFPVDCIPRHPRPQPGALYSVNPFACRVIPQLLEQNKRSITLLETDYCGLVAYIEVGATFVGSIHQTFVPDQWQPKGAEKGFFSYGGSSIILLFEPGRVFFDKDLLENTKRRLETYVCFGDSIASVIK